MQNINSFSEITPELLALSKLSKEHGQIDPALYTKYDVKRGLRDLSGKGVLAGLTDISEITSYIIEDSDIQWFSPRILPSLLLTQSPSVDGLIPKVHRFQSANNDLQIPL